MPLAGNMFDIADATDMAKVWGAVDAVDTLCYVLGFTQGAFFIFHLLTKPFPSRDQLPTHLDHMTNHLTSHLTTHMTSHMPFQSPAPQSHLSYITCSQVTCASPDTLSPDLT